MLRIHPLCPPMHPPGLESRGVEEGAPPLRCTHLESRGVEEGAPPRQQLQCRSEAHAVDLAQDEGLTGCNQHLQGGGGRAGGGGERAVIRTFRWGGGGMGCGESPTPARKLTHPHLYNNIPSFEDQGTFIPCPLTFTQRHFTPPTPPTPAAAAPPAVRSPSPSSRTPRRTARSKLLAGPGVA